MALDGVALVCHAARYAIIIDAEVAFMPGWHLHYAGRAVAILQQPEGMQLPVVRIPELMKTGICYCRPVGCLFEPLKPPVDQIRPTVATPCAIRGEIPRRGN